MDRISSEKYFLYIAAGISALISILDLFGILENIPWLNNRLSTITLLLVSGLVLYLVNSLSTLEEKIDKSDIQIENLGSYVQQDTLEKLSALREYIDPNLQAVFNEHISDLLTNIERALKGQEIRLFDINLFRYFFKRTFQAYPNSTFFATSFPYERFFWKNRSVEDATDEFLSAGGRIERIFYVKNQNELNISEVKEILETQCILGVQVYIALIDEIPPDLQRLFLVESQGRIAWEAFIKADGAIREVVATSDPRVTSDYLQKFHQLIALASVMRYTFKTVLPFTPMELHAMTNTPSSSQDIFRKFEHTGWQKAADSYHSYWENLTSQSIEPLLDAVNATSGIFLLDVASGPGYVAGMAAKRGARVIGVDFADIMVTKARQIYPSIEFREGSAEDLPFPDDTFDAVTISFGLLHFALPDKALSEANRVLKSGGRIAFTVWAQPEHAKGFEIVLNAIKKHGTLDVPLPPGPPFFRFSDYEECKRALQIAGFQNATSSQILQTWHLPSPQALFLAFYEGTARTGPMLRAQSGENLIKIRRAITRNARMYEKNGVLEIPMPAVLASAVKP